MLENSDITQLTMIRKNHITRARAITRGLTAGPTLALAATSWLVATAMTGFAIYTLTAVVLLTAVITLFCAASYTDVFLKRMCYMAAALIPIFFILGALTNTRIPITISLVLSGAYLIGIFSAAVISVKQISITSPRINRTFEIIEMLVFTAPVPILVITIELMSR